MLNKRAWRIFDSNSTEISLQLCFRCPQCTRRSLNIVRRHFLSTSTGFERVEANGVRRERVSTIARAIRKSGQLPSLPREAVVRLSPLRSRRQSRSKNIVRDDLKATIEAHKAANTLQRGFIQLNLHEDLSNKVPQRLAVQPPQEPELEEQDRDELPKPIARADNQQKVVKHADHPTELQLKLMTLDRTCDALSRLDAEIQVFTGSMRVSKEEEAAVQRISQDLESCLKEEFPKYKLEVHGSRATGLARPMSDIDIRLWIPDMLKQYDVRGPSPGRPTVQARHKRALVAVRRYLFRNFDATYEVGDIRYGRVPLLDLRDRRYNLAIQIAALQVPTQRATEFTKYFQSEYPQIRPLFTLLRWWARQVDYDEASHGGVSSYLMFNMIVTSITHSDELYDSQELGQQLINFFEFWSKAKVFDFGFAPDPPRVFPKFATNIVEEDLHVKEDEDKSMPLKHKLSTSERPTMMETEQHTFALKQPISSTLGPTPKHPTSPINQESDVYLEGIKYLTKQMRKAFIKTNSKRCQPALLLQDLADPYNNIGNSAGRFISFQKEMKRALAALRASMEDWNREQQAAERRSDSSASSGPLPTPNQPTSKASKSTTSSSYLIQSLLQAGEPTRTNSLQFRLQKLERGRRRFENVSVPGLRRMDASRKRGLVAVTDADRLVSGLEGVA